ncbi:MAG: hypothetical protein L6V93_01105 [Clostridiales bacterium]|nr:MAG: hypothetical protein L6V93_01105 [Clostridiales bacterium]
MNATQGSAVNTGDLFNHP